MKRLVAFLRTVRTERRVRTDGGTADERSTAGRWRDSDFLQSAPFWGPPLVLMGLFVYGAIGWNFLLSLTDHSGFGRPDYTDLGLQNYWAMIQDPSIWEATRNTVVLLVVFTLACLAVGLVLAILLDREIRFGRTFRTVYLLPFALSFIVTAQFWRWMYNVNDGIINQFFGLFGLGPYNWLGDPRLVLGAVIFALVWQFSGYTMVIYLAALRSIPTAQYEAARVDGAGTFRMYRRVIVPQLRPAIVSATVVLVLFALKAFDFLYAVFDGYRPRQGSDILATKMMREGFNNSEWAYSSAIGLTLFVLSLAVIAPYLYTQYKRGNL
ncbi:carbohydrate ABC transporter permease [Natronococcus jeotgali]|uniref:carbohydrate ABC transporter permease n=1 Tax=Natronococcus jeotgali TaxID=413812 RepID=UPI000678182C|nr:sugar ABC transporter permease [Natronococcus jeotgali]